MWEQRFRDRTEAGRLLGAELSRRYGARPSALVLGLPRGGVPVAYEVATALGAPLDVFIVRKLGVPGHEELAMGAIASGGVRVMNDDVLRYVPIRQQAIDAVAAREQQELERRERSYRGAKPPLDVSGKTVFVVDDGLATGSSMRAAVRALRSMNAQEVIVAVPVAAEETCEEFRSEVDDIVCLRTPSPFQAVGLWYDDFSQTTDAEVHDLLAPNPAHA
jgi:putative phosphoribosyl transferase